MKFVSALQTPSFFIRVTSAHCCGMNQSHRLGIEQWRSIISAQPASGLSIARYCRERGISQPSFFAWRRRLGQAAAEGAGSAKPAAAFVQVKARVPEARPAAGIELRLRGGRRLVLRNGFDRGLLMEVVRTLEAMA